jgi:hypothetical protein
MNSISFWFVMQCGVSDEHTTSNFMTEARNQEKMKQAQLSASC